MFIIFLHTWAVDYISLTVHIVSTFLVIALKFWVETDLTTNFPGNISDCVKHHFLEWTGCDNQLLKTWCSILRCLSLWWLTDQVKSTFIKVQFQNVSQHTLQQIIKTIKYNTQTKI